MIDKVIKINVDTKEIDRLSIGARLYDAFDYSNDKINLYCILKYDNDKKEVLIKENDLLELVKLVNREQKLIDKEPYYQRVRLI